MEKASKIDIIHNNTPKPPLASSNNEITEFPILREVRREVSRNATSDFQRANSGLFRRQGETEYIFFSLCKELLSLEFTELIALLSLSPTMQNKNMYHHRESKRKRKVEKGK